MSCFGTLDRYCYGMQFSAQFLLENAGPRTPPFEAFPIHDYPVIRIYTICAASKASLNKPIIIRYRLKY